MKHALSNNGGKGDAQRTVDKAQYNKNFDNIKTGVLKPSREWQVKKCKGVVDKNVFSECGCKFANDQSNEVILCEVCSKLDVHNPHSREELPGMWDESDFTGGETDA